MKNTPLILGIESSCDETAVAIVSGAGEILGQKLISQIDDHAPYGGVVPEIAARQHILHIEPLATALFEETHLGLADMDAIAATSGPGLIGGVITGMMMGKSMALVSGKPFYGINHLEGHALSVRLGQEVAFPYLLFLMSGGHCQILLVHGVGRYQLLGQTLDDAIGEAFDKSAKMMGLGYPGGPAIEAHAKSGDAERFTFPRPYLNRAGCDMSFSGLKTAVRTQLLKLDEAGGVSEQDKADVAACLQAALSDIVAQRLDRAAGLCKADGVFPSALVVAGGVAANQAIRARLIEVAAEHNVPFIAPPLALCTDNAAMIAWAGAERLHAGLPADALDIEPKARWPLAELT